MRGLPLRILLIVSFLAGPAAASAADEAKPTRIRFPRKHGFGKLALVDAGTTWQEMDRMSGKSLERFKERTQPVGGTITVPPDKKVWLLFVNPQAKRPGWAGYLSPLDQFQPDDILVLGLPFATLKPREIERLQRHRGLEALTLGPFSSFGDASLAPLAEMTWLESLGLPEADVTDAGLRHLTRLTRLKKLILYGTEVSDRGLEHLAGMREMRELDLGRTDVAGPGLRHLRKLSELRRLVLWGTDVDDAALRHLAPLRKLRELDLKETQVTDAGLRHLEGITSLTRLDLGSTGVSDTGLEHLSAMSNLEVLILSRTKVSKAGAEKIKRAVPGLKVLSSRASETKD
jgi:hypothetical protein